MSAGWRDGFLSRFLCCLEPDSLEPVSSTAFSYGHNSASLWNKLSVSQTVDVNRKTQEIVRWVWGPRSAWWGTGSKHSKLLPVRHFWEMERHPSMTSSFFFLCFLSPLLTQCSGHAESRINYVPTICSHLTSNTGQHREALPVLVLNSPPVNLRAIQQVVLVIAL